MLFLISNLMSGANRQFFVRGKLNQYGFFRLDGPARHEAQRAIMPPHLWKAIFV
jgi:hypothetical protein